MVDSLDSGSSVHSGRAGSSPASRTIVGDPSARLKNGKRFMRLPFFQLCSGSPPLPIEPAALGFDGAPVLKNNVRKPIPKTVTPKGWPSFWYTKPGTRNRPAQSAAGGDGRALPFLVPSGVQVPPRAPSSEIPPHGSKTANASCACRFFSCAPGLLLSPSNPLRWASMGPGFMYCKLARDTPSNHWI